MCICVWGVYVCVYGEREKYIYLNVLRYKSFYMLPIHFVLIYTWNFTMPVHGIFMYFQVWVKCYSLGPKSLWEFMADDHNGRHNRGGEAIGVLHRSGEGD